MNIKLLGIDIAKHIFQLHGVDAQGKWVLKKKLKRSELLTFTVNLPPCTMVMEACGGAHYWARQFKQQGHHVKLISPQYVKPFVRTNKNDLNDAQAIVEAASRPHMNFVPVKTIEQHDIQMLHRIRERVVQQRTQLTNQLRGLLLEYGIVINPGRAALVKQLPEILEDGDNELTDLTRELCHRLYEELKGIEAHIDGYDEKLKRIYQQQSVCQRLGKIEGVGPVTATALLTVVGDPNLFRNGRHFAAFLGLVPRQHSSGGKERLLGISKRGNTYVRTLLIHGARAVIAQVEKKQDTRSQWIKQIKERRGMNRACVALANKNARIIWALLAHETEYRQPA